MGRDIGFFLVGAGAIVGSPFLLFWGLFVIITSPPYYLATASAMGAGAGIFSAATLGFGAAIVYGVAGVAYMYSSASQAYSSNDSVWDIVKSRVIPQGQLGIMTVVKAVGSALWAPFLVLGSLTGKGVKLAVNAVSDSNTASAYSSADDDGSIVNASLATLGAGHLSQPHTAPVLVKGRDGAFFSMDLKKDASEEDAAVLGMSAPAA